jgi:hypothetical protein
MLGQDVPPIDTSSPSWGADFSAIAAQLPAMVTGYEQARLYNAATSAQISQINQWGNINPLWILGALALVLIAFARR